MVEFKTSFIPKKPLGATPMQKTGSGVNLVLFVTAIVFFAVVLIAGAVFLYGALLTRQEASLTSSVSRAQAAIEPELVASLGRIDARIKTAQELLDNHIILSPLFKLLEQLTLSSVSFDSFRYLVEADGKITLHLSGIARNYASVALQSVLFGENRFIENPIFSNLRLNNQGNVTFNFTAEINKRLLLYKNNVAGTVPANF